MQLIKCICLICNETHEWVLSERSFYPPDFKGDMRVLMQRKPDVVCKANSQFIYKSKIEHAPAS